MLIKYMDLELHWNYALTVQLTHTLKCSLMNKINYVCGTTQAYRLELYKTYR